MTASTSASFLLIAAAAAAQAIGGLVTQMSPLIVGGVIAGLSLSESQAGVVASSEFLVLSITAIAIAPLLPRLPTRAVCLAAVAATIAASLASLAATTMTQLIATRVVAGVGEGLLYAASLSVVAAKAGNPDRIYGIFQIIWAVSNFAFFAVGGELTARFAHRGILGLIAAVIVVLAPLLLFLPKEPLATAKTSETTETTSAPLLGAAVLLSTFLYLTVSAAVYAFSAPMGERAGLDTAQVGYALTAASIVGLAGAGLATLVNVRWGRSIPIAAFIVGFIALALALCLSSNPTVFVVALIGTVVFFYFSVPYLFGLAAALDRSGRWAAAAGSAYLLGFAAGPMLAGSVIGAFGYTGLGIVSTAFALAAWALAALVVRRIELRPQPELASAPA